MKKNPTKPYSVNRTGRISKIQRKWMKVSGEWFLKGMPGYQMTLEDFKQLAEKLKLEKSKNLLAFEGEE